MVVVVLIRLPSMRVRAPLLLVGLVAKVRPRIACALAPYIYFAARIPTIVVLCARPAARPPSSSPASLLLDFDSTGVAH